MELEDELPTVTQYEGRLHEGANVLYDCLEAQTALMEKATLVATYANLRSSEDGTNAENQANSAKVSATLAKVGAALSL